MKLGSLSFGVFGRAQNQDDSAGAGGWKQIIRDDSNYLGSTVAGSLGGIFWTGAGWPGVIAFATALLLLAIALPGF